MQCPSTTVLDLLLSSAKQSYAKRRFSSGGLETTTVNESIGEHPSSYIPNLFVFHIYDRSIRILRTTCNQPPSDLITTSPTTT